MAQLDIRNYLYHTIRGSRYNKIDDIFESILKDGYLLFGEDLKKRNIISSGTYYDEVQGHSPRISFGFYPLNEEVHKIVYDASRYKYSIPENLREHIKKRYNVSEEELENGLSNVRFNSSNFAWPYLYDGITLIFDPSLLKKLPVSDYAGLFDEVCVDEKVSLRDYLVAVSMTSWISRGEDWYPECIIEYDIETYEVDRYAYVHKLLKKYGYNVPIINFKTGKEMGETGPILVRRKKNINKN